MKFFGIFICVFVLSILLLFKFDDALVQLNILSYIPLPASMDDYLTNISIVKFFNAGIIVILFILLVLIVITIPDIIKSFLKKHIGDEDDK